MRFALPLTLLAVACASAPPPHPTATVVSAPSPPPARVIPGAKLAPPLPTDAKPWAFASGAPVAIKVNVDAEIAEVTPLHFGNNAAWYDGKDWLRSAGTVDRATQSGIRFWRWPGGSSSDSYHWDGNNAGHAKDHDGNATARMTDQHAAHTDDFIDFCKATHSEAIVTINYGVARYGSVQKAADLAARWVRYFNIEKGFKVRYWEIGNEVYGNWEEGNKISGKPQLTGAIYGKDFNVIARAMREVDPDIRIGAVAVDIDSGDEWTGYRWWMRDMLPVIADSADFLISHNYFLWPFEGDKFVNPPADKIFANIGKIARARSDIDAMVKKYTQRGEPLPVLLTEFNVVNASAPQTIQLVSGLFAAEALGEGIRAGYAAINIWDWKNGLDPKLKGDHGMLATADSSVPESTPRPTFYAYALYDRAFGARMLDASSSDPRVKVFASRFGAGEVGIVVVNEASSPITLNVDIGSAPRRGTAVGWVLDGIDLDAKQVRWNGVGGPEGGGGPFPVAGIPPYVARFEGNQPVRLDLPANCAAGIVFY